jgi:hypothetical protein
MRPASGSTRSTRSPSAIRRPAGTAVPGATASSSRIALSTRAGSAVALHAGPSLAASTVASHFGSVCSTSAWTSAALSGGVDLGPLGWHAAASAQPITASDAVSLRLLIIGSSMVDLAVTSFGRC